MDFNNVEAAIKDLQEGKLIVVFDDESRENEGDLICCGEKITAEKLNFIIKYARGLVCAPISQEIAQQFDLDLMVQDNKDKYGTAYTISVDAAEGTTTGISAGDRANTIKVLTDPSKGSDDLLRPGHMFPLIAKNGGLMVRVGHTEASVDLARLAGMREVGVICEIIKDNGEMARMSDLKQFSQEHNLTMISIPDIMKYRFAKEALVEKKNEEIVQTPFGQFKVVTWSDTFKGGEHCAFVKGTIDTAQPVLTKIHWGDFTADLVSSLNQIQEHGSGVVVCLDWAKNDLVKCMNEFKMDEAKTNQMSSFDAAIMHAGMSAQILRALGVQKINQLCSKADEKMDLSPYGIETKETVPLKTMPSGITSPGKWDQAGV